MMMIFNNDSFEKNSVLLFFFAFFFSFVYCSFSHDDEIRKSIENHEALII